MKEKVILENNSLEEELTILKSNNEQLKANKAGLALELRRAKEELATLIDRTEKQKLAL